MDNVALLGIVFVSVIAVTGLVKREPIVNVFSNKWIGGSKPTVRTSSGTRYDNRNSSRASYRIGI